VHDIEPAGRRSSAANPLSWQQAQRAAWSADLAGPPSEVVVRAVVVTCLAYALVGVAGAWVWAQLADPPAYHVFSQAILMDEEEAGREFGVDLTYALVALGLAAPVGFVTGWRWHRVGWPQVLATAGGAAIAAVISWRLGIVLGPDDPQESIRTAQVGDDIPDKLDVHADGLLAAWPVAALIGLIVAVLLFSRPSRPRPYRSPSDPDVTWRSPGVGPDPG
jgi:ribose/xylose/arabinose/galactoside ABC-type transport system permease subunit